MTHVVCIREGGRSHSDLQTEFTAQYNISQKRLRLEEIFDSDSADLARLTVFAADIFECREKQQLKHKKDKYRCHLPRLDCYKTAAVVSKPRPHHLIPLRQRRLWLNDACRGGCCQDGESN